MAITFFTFFYENKCDWKEKQGIEPMTLAQTGRRTCDHGGGAYTIIKCIVSNRNDQQF